MSSPIIALTPGDPASVGPELALQVLGDDPSMRVLLVASHALLADSAKRLGMPFDLPLYRPGEDWESGARCLDIALRAPAIPGQLDTANAAYVLDTLNTAIDGCLRGDFHALVTGPVHKGIINDAGLPFTGHTELLAERSKASHVVMMLATEALRVALVTTHLPLAKVPAAITRAEVENTVRIVHQELRLRFQIPDPRILVCGLNPHAGEGGHLGSEDGEVIEPVLRSLQQQGFQVVGPLPADTAFTPRALKGADVVIAMYHDQGLPVLKYAGFGHAVNVTLGLPMIRTSVDHGTALDLAGTGKADPGSLRAALAMACQLAAPVATPS